MTVPIDLLIIGGSGFLSGTLARRAAALGHHVWCVTRGRRPLPPGVRSLVADRQNRAAFAAAIRQAGVRWDLAVDCIAFEPGDIEQDIAALSPLAAHLVFVSTDFVYDPAHRRFPQDEHAERYASAGYGARKRASEEALAAADAGAMCWTILRPGHIYGPGSLLGCLPAHARDAQLLDRLRAREPLRLVGGGHFLQQPVYAPDLCDTILSLHGNPNVAGQTLLVAGPEITESRAYYRAIADVLGVPLTVEELPVDAFRAEHPEAGPFLCHRIYDLRRLQATGAHVPSTPLAEGLAAHVASLLHAS
jgi:nucleoside-diphosphate-sugar epimerase